MIDRQPTPVEWQPVTTRSADGVDLRGISAPGPSGTRVRFVVCHGMTNSNQQPGTRRVLTDFARSGAVVAFDFRGHGRSGGRSTVGLDEVADVAAAIAFARAAGPEPVVVVGFSMGAAVVLRQQGMVGRQHDPEDAEQAEPDVIAEQSGGEQRSGEQTADRADAVVSVSAPARWFLRESKSMRRVQWLLEHPGGSLLGPRLGIRLGQPWTDIPTTPVQEVAGISPTPLLLVHGTRDDYFGTEQATTLHRAAPGSQLWIVDGMGHGESGTTADTVTRIAEWATTATGT